MMILKMVIEANEVFAVEVEGSVYHLGCTPAEVEFTESDIIAKGDEDSGSIYFCDACGNRIG